MYGIKDHCRMYLGIKPYDTDITKHDPYLLTIRIKYDIIKSPKERKEN